MRHISFGYTFLTDMSAKVYHKANKHIWSGIII